MALSPFSPYRVLLTISPTFCILTTDYDEQIRVPHVLKNMGYPALSFLAEHVLLKARCPHNPRLPTVSCLIHVGIILSKLRI